RPLRHRARGSTHRRLRRGNCRADRRARPHLSPGADRESDRLRHGYAAAAARTTLHSFGPPHRRGHAQSLRIRLNPTEIAMRQFLLPDLGEGLEEAEIVTWHVNEGDRVVTEQPLVSVETDKAVVEVPSPWTGRIARVFANKGDLVKVGAPLVEFAEGAEQDTGTVVGQLDTGEKQAAIAERPAESAPARMLQVLPAVRALAHKLDVDLNAVQPTGPGGTIPRADVDRAAHSLAEPR